MAKREDEKNEKETTNSRKQLQEHLIDQLELDEDFVRVLAKGMDEYDEALKNLTKR